MPLAAAVLEKPTRRANAALIDSDQDDARLLGRFTRQGDEAAFKALLQRHGGMVLQVARRVLGGRSDVDDVYQATFLTLARRAGAIRKPDALHCWLHGVTLRLALKTRADVLRREAQPVPVARSLRTDPASDLSSKELAGVLDEELARLPAKYRAPILLCLLEEHTQEEAARLLSCPLGTLRSRLERGRTLMRSRLVRRGLPAALTALAGRSADAAASPFLKEMTLRGAAAFARGQAPSVSPRALALAEELLDAMNATTYKLVSVLLPVLALAGFVTVLSTLDSAGPPKFEYVAYAEEPRAQAKPNGQQAGSWPLFRGDALQTGIAKGELPAPLVKLWEFKTKDTIEAAAAIANDTVYVASMDGNLYALEFDTGKPRWSYKGGPFKCAPSIGPDGNIYIGDFDGLFHCVDAKTGKGKWTFKTGGEIVSGCNFTADAVLFGSYADEHLYKVDLKGNQVWKFKTEGPVNGAPAVAGDRTFVAGCDSQLRVLDLDKGKEQSAVDLGGPAGASGAVKDNHLYVGTMSNEVLAIDWKTGKVSWRFEAKRNQQPFYASAALTDDLVIVGSRDRRLYAIERKTGKEAWNFQTKGKVDSSPVVAGKHVYFGSADGNLYVLDLKGTQVQAIKLGEGILASPAVASGRLIIGTEDGVVFCLGAKK